MAPSGAARGIGGARGAILLRGEPPADACEACVRAHEKTVTDGGLTADHVNDAVRIAATIYAAAVALESAETPSRPPSLAEASTPAA